MKIVKIIKALYNIYFSKKNTEQDQLNLESEYYNNVLKRIKESENIGDILKQNNINKIGILASGYTGKSILKAFLKTDCEVVFYDDNTASKKVIQGVPVLKHLQDILPKVDAVIICEHQFSWIRFQLENWVADDTIIVSIDDVLDNNIVKQSDSYTDNNKTDEISFLGAGFSKCGTTTMDAILRQHPQIQMACHKEPLFWSEEPLYKLGVDWYLKRYYPKKTNGKIKGEFNPWVGLCSYEYYAEKYLNNVKYIYIIRNPLDAAISKIKHYFINGHYGVEDGNWDFTEDSIRQFVSKQLVCEDYTRTLSEYRYGKHFSNVLRQIDRERILIIDFDEFISNQEETAKKVFAFIGVDPDVKINYNLKLNVGTRVPKSAKAIEKAHKSFRFWWEVYIPYFPYMGKFERVMDKWRWSISDRASIPSDVKVSVPDDTKEALKDFYRDDIKLFDELFGTNYVQKWGL